MPLIEQLNIESDNINPCIFEKYIDRQQSCITNKVTNLDGEDQQGKTWEICTRSNCY